MNLTIMENELMIWRDSYYVSLRNVVLRNDPIIHWTLNYPNLSKDQISIISAMITK